MKLRVYAALLTAFTMLISSTSQAQIGYGYGAWAGMQACQGYGRATGASSEDDEITGYKQDRADLRIEKRDLEKKTRQLENEIDKMKDSITDVIKPAWANVIMEHMDKGNNCQICGTTPIGTTPVGSVPQAMGPSVTTPRDLGTEIEIYRMRESAPAPVQPARVIRPEPNPAPAPPVQPNPDDGLGRPTDPGKPQKRRNRKDLSDNLPALQSRMPAGDAVSATAGPRVQGAAPEFDGPGADEFNEAGFNENVGSPGACYPRNVRPYSGKPWYAICSDAGKIRGLACTHKFFQVSGAERKDVRACSRALDQYRKKVVELDKTQIRLARIDDEIDRLNEQIKVVERSNREMEADCPTGKCGSGGSRSRASGPSTGQLLMAGVLDGLQMLGAYKLGNNQIKMDGRTGNGTSINPWVTMGMGFPYRTASLYGATYGGVNGGFGCSPSVGGGGYQMGPYGPGAGSPWMYGNGGGPFGYPQQGYYPNMSAQIGAGMYMPGYGPQGYANGPWGVASPNNYWIGAGGQAGAWGGGYPTGYPGGIPNYPGAGFPGAGYPGYPGAYPGAYPGYPTAGYPGFPYGGIGGGYSIGAGGSPFGTPYSAYPGFAGIPGIGGPYSLPGMPGQFPSPFGGFDAQVINRQLEAQQASLQRYSSFLQEYNAFYSKWNNMFSGGGSSFSPSYSPTTGGSGPTTGTIPNFGR